MVTSGLVDDPRVSQYRLTAHLSLALAIYAAMLWTALDLFRRTGAADAAHRIASSRDPVAAGTTDVRGGASHRVRHLGWVITALVTYMIVTGGFVAGIRAGLAYNTFPLMNGHFVPPEMFVIEPWYLNFFSNMATVQFDHRLGAWMLAALVPWLWIRARAEAAPVRRAADLLLAAVALQITLGISTLLLRVPVALGAAHQGGAVLVLTAALALNHFSRSSRTR
jgi:cytochrome c oxidase assembly protein subunit 15